MHSRPPSLLPRLQFLLPFLPTTPATPASGPGVKPSASIPPPGSPSLPSQATPNLLASPPARSTALADTASKSLAASASKTASVCCGPAVGAPATKSATNAPDRLAPASGYSGSLSCTHRSTPTTAAGSHNAAVRPLPVHLPGALPPRSSPASGPAPGPPPGRSEPDGFPVPPILHRRKE